MDKQKAASLSSDIVLYSQRKENKLIFHLNETLKLKNIILKRKKNFFKARLSHKLSSSFNLPDIGSDLSKDVEKFNCEALLFKSHSSNT